MVNAVWKFPIALFDRFTVQMPKGAEVLYVAVQGGAPFMWASVDVYAAPEPRSFRVAGTGHPIANVGRHCGSFMLEAGALVFHVFEDLT